MVPAGIGQRHLLLGPHITMGHLLLLRLKGNGKTVPVRSGCLRPGGHGVMPAFGIQRPGNGGTPVRRGAPLTVLLRPLGLAARSPHISVVRHGGNHPESRPGKMDEPGIQANIGHIFQSLKSEGNLKGAGAQRFHLFPMGYSVYGRNLKKADDGLPILQGQAIPHLNHIVDARSAGNGQRAQKKQNRQCKPVADGVHCASSR